MSRVSGEQGPAPPAARRRRWAGQVLHWAVGIGAAVAAFGVVFGRRDELTGALGELVSSHLQAQAEAGVQAVQVFDSWVGALDPDDYFRFVLPGMRDIFDRLAGLDVPRIHFGVGTGELLTLMRDSGADVIGMDWRVPLHEAWERIGFDVAVQGNLDPAVCLAPWEAVESKALAVLRRAAGRPGHVFNLGHGVLPGTPVENLQRLVELVHERTLRGVAARTGEDR